MNQENYRMPEVNLEYDNLPPTVHPANTIRVTVSGVESHKLTIDNVRTFISNNDKIPLTSEDLDMGYKLEYPFNYFIILKKGVDITPLHGKNYDLKPGLTATINDANKVVTTFYLNHIPPTFDEPIVGKIATQCLPDLNPEKILEIKETTKGRIDQYQITAEVSKDEVPHYVKIKSPRNANFHDMMILVKLPGRKIECPYC